MINFYLLCSLACITVEIFNECDDNSTEKAATDINQAMVIDTNFGGGLASLEAILSVPDIPYFCVCI